MTIKIFADITDKRMKIQQQQQQQQQQKKRTFLSLLRRQKMSFLFGIFVVVVLVNNINHPPPTRNMNNMISINDNSNNDNNNGRHQEEDNDDIEAYAKRHNYYKERYRYQPPEKRPTDDDDDYQRYVTNLCGPSPGFPNYFAQRKWDRSQFLEDMTLYKLLFKSNNNNITDDQSHHQQQQKIQKTFVELGAFDGKHWSNTRFFEYCLNWSPGILIEASQGIYPRLVEQRPFTHRFNFAPSCINGMENNSTLTFEATNRPASGIAADDNTTTTSNKEEETVDVPCGPLGPILEDFIMKDHPDVGITLFSLDVEKSEPTVLKTIDFDKIKVDVWIIECFDCRKEGSIIPESAIETRQIMKSHNYKRYEGVITHSDLFIHQDSPYQLPPSSNIKEVE